MQKTTAERIRHYREQASMSQRELENKIDLSPSTITRIENNDRDAKSYELAAIARALGMPISSLMESNDFRDRLQYTARTVPDAAPNMESVKDHLRYLLEMDNYLIQAPAVHHTSR